VKREVEHYRNTIVAKLKEKKRGQFRRGGQYEEKGALCEGKKHLRFDVPGKKKGGRKVARLELWGPAPGGPRVTVSTGN